MFLEVSEIFSGAVKIFYVVLYKVSLFNGLEKQYLAGGGDRG